MSIVVYECRMYESGMFEAKRRTAAASAKLKRG
jgi:hypothetical protein